MADGRSKIRRRAMRIRRELAEEYMAGTPLARRRMWSASRYLALAEMTLDLIGRDPKATARAATRYQKTAQAELAALRPLAPPATPGNGHPAVTVKRFSGSRA